MVRFLVTYEQPDDPAAFDRHYHEIHLPLAKQLPGLRHYRVGRNTRAIRGEAWYLVAELEWESMEALQAAFASPIGRATAEDVSKFAPTGVRSVIYEATEL